MCPVTDNRGQVEQIVEADDTGFGVADGISHHHLQIAGILDAEGFDQSGGA